MWPKLGFHLIFSFTFTFVLVGYSFRIPRLFYYLCNPVWELLSTGFEFIILGCTKGPEDNLLPYPSVAVDSDFKHSNNGKDQS